MIWIEGKKRWNTTSHLGDEAGVGESQEESSEDYENLVGLDEGLLAGLPQVGLVGQRQVGEEVGEEGEEEAQHHHGVPAPPKEGMGGYLVVWRPKKPKVAPAITSPAEMAIRVMAATPFLTKKEASEGKGEGWSEARASNLSAPSPS